MINIPISEFSILNGAEALAHAKPSEIKEQNWFYLGKNRITYYQSDVGLFHLSDGSQLHYTVADQVNQMAFAGYVSSTIFSSICYQRGEIPIHGSGLIPPGEACATIICGHSGAGKSTTSALLALKGRGRCFNSRIYRRAGLRISCGPSWCPYWWGSRLPCRMGNVAIVVTRTS